MPWTVEYDTELKIVAGSYVGRITDDDFKQASVQAINLAKENNTNLFLIDDSEWEGGTSVVGLFSLPDLYDELQVDRKSRAALIPPNANNELATSDARFYETVCRNRGYNVRIFPSREEAIDWLLDSNSRVNELIVNDSSSGN